MPPPWVTLVDLIRNGEAVSAGVTNRPISELGQRTEYLKSLLDMLSLGRSIFDIDAPMNPAVLEGQPVYWDGANLEYAQALAQLSYNAEGVYNGNADSAYVLGICAGKSSQTRGTVLYTGSADGIDFTAATEDGGPLGSGPYFLSAAQAGKLTQNRPAVGIYVLFGKGTTDAVVVPSPREVLENHIHYRLALAYGDVIDGAGSTGWTDIFNVSLAPVGARFRYQVENDAPVYSLFPFYPASSIYFEIDGIGANVKVTIDLNGIWWIDPSHDPDEYDLMTVYYAKSSLSTSNLLVRTLQPWTMSGPLQVVNCRGEAATSGDLYLQLNLQFQQTTENTPGWLVFKELTSGQQFARGPIVQRVRSTSQEISITLNGANGYDWGDGFLSGDLLFTYNSPTSVSRSLDPTLTELYGAQQEDYNGLPYIALPPAGFQSGVSFRFDVPLIGLDGEFSLTFNAWVYTSLAGACGDALDVDITIVRSVVGTAHNLLTDPLSVISITGKQLTFPAGTTMDANGYRLAQCSDLDANTIEPGDQVHVKVSRGATVTYSGTLGIMKAWSEMVQV
jgi:hypothetical protein